MHFNGEEHLKLDFGGKMQGMPLDNEDLFNSTVTQKLNLGAS
jgi:hypothetical protein